MGRALDGFLRVLAEGILNALSRGVEELLGNHLILQIN